MIAQVEWTEPDAAKRGVARCEADRFRMPEGIVEHLDKEYILLNRFPYIEAMRTRSGTLLQIVFIPSHLIYKTIHGSLPGTEAVGSEPDRWVALVATPEGIVKIDPDKLSVVRI